MGIGRREFLKQFGTALASLAVCASPAVALLDDLYINRRLGIAFQKFSGWHFSNVQDMGELKAGQILALEDLEAVNQIKEQTEMPLVCISKKPVSLQGHTFEPGINFYLDRYHFHDSADGLWTNIEMDLSFCQRVLKDFKVEAAPARLTVSNCEALCYDSTFLFEHTNLAVPVPVRMASLLVVQQPSWYSFRMYDSPFLGAAQTVNFGPFIESIQIL